MKIGSEEKTKVRVMLALVAVAALVGLYNLWGGTNTAAAPAAPAAAATTQKKDGSLSSLDPTLRLDILHASQNIQYREGGRNIFKMEQASAVIPTMSQGVRPSQGPYNPPITTQAVTPALPDITIKFYGFANKPGEQKKAFLSDGGEVFIAREGQIVDRRYKIVQIGNASLMVEDVLNNNRKSIPLSTSTAPN